MHRCIGSGSVVVLNCEPDECLINKYNLSVMLAWQANVDIQFVLNAYACVMYVAIPTIQGFPGYSRESKANSALQGIDIQPRDFNFSAKPSQSTESVTSSTLFFETHCVPPLYHPEHAASSG